MFFLINNLTNINSNNMNINITDEYNFNFFDFNRDINQQHVNFLADSIKRIGLQVPIVVVIVGSRSYVEEGQHRYLACKQVGMPIKYIIKKDWKRANFDLVEMNKNVRPFETWDYVKYFALKFEAANFVKAYNIAKKYRNNTINDNKLNKNNAIELLHKGGSPKNIIKNMTNESHFSKFKLNVNRAENVFNCLQGMSEYVHRKKGNLMTANYIRTFKQLYDEYGTLNVRIFQHQMNNKPAPRLDGIGDTKKYYKKQYEDGLKLKRYHLKKAI